MNIKLIKGNIFTSQCQTLVNTVNCVGIMGAGIALEYRLRYPEMYDKYKEICDKKLLSIGKLWIYKSNKKWILNFPTKDHWKNPSKIEYLERGMEKFLDTYKDREISSVAFPLLGADRGGIDSKISLDLMYSYLKKANDITIEIYQHDPAAKDDLFELAKGRLLSHSVEELTSKTGLRRDYVVKVLEALSNQNIYQINQLARVKGIGIVTLEKIYRYALSH